MTKDISELDQRSNQVGLTLYTQEEWDKARQESEERGFSFEYNQMREEAFAATFEEYPEAFAGIDYINSDEGLPLWVREGYEWEPEEVESDEEDD